MKNKIKEIIVCEGRDDTAAIRRAVDAETIETHGFGMSPAMWEQIEKAACTSGIIVFTDPDHAGGLIRRKIKERFPDAKEAFLPREEARKKDNIGVENASPEAIREALSKARCTLADGGETFSQEDFYSRDDDSFGPATKAGIRPLQDRTFGVDPHLNHSTGHGPVFMGNHPNVK